MSRHFDAVVIGGGPAGEVAVSRLAEQGLKVALCERELIGGECAYWACIPSIHQNALAIKAHVPLEVLRDTVAQFPTFSEAYLKGVESLDA